MGATDVGQAHKQHAQARSANGYTSIVCSHITGNNTTKKDVRPSISLSAVILHVYENTLKDELLTHQILPKGTQLVDEVHFDEQH